jgi:crossover junction endodeoxyribonuclease RusA
MGAVMRGFEDVPIDWAPASVWCDDDGNWHQTMEFIVPGQPEPQGSKVLSRYGHMYESAKGLPLWRAKVSDQARAAMKGRYRNYNPALPIFSSAVMVDVTFIRRRPKSMSKNAPVTHIKKPDTSKLLRAIEDSMTGIVYHDDSQVIEAHPRKRYAYPDETPGAIILVTSNVKVE